MLNADPTSTYKAACTVCPIIGIRYSKLPRIWVSAPVAVYMRGSAAMLVPVEPVKVPIVDRFAGSPGTTLGVPEALVATTTLRDVMKLSSGVTGLIERTL